MRVEGDDLCLVIPAERDSILIRELVFRTTELRSMEIMSSEESHIS